MFPNVQIEMEKHPPAQLSPSHSHLSCASTRTRARGYLYDDYAREIPALPTVVYPDSRALPQTIKKKSTLYIAAWLAVILFLIQLGGSLTDVPSTRLLEDLLCHEYYHDTTRGLLHEDKCLIDAVQSELNILATGVLLTTYLPGLLVAIPYGSLADQRGRKCILGLCVLGMCISKLLWAAIAWNWGRWSLRYVWTSSAALLIGGGESVAEAMVFAMITDVASEGKCAAYFQLEICAVLLAESVAPLAAAAMMGYSIWLPLLASPVIIAIGGLLVTAIPETLELKSTTERARAETQPTAPVFSRRARRYAQTFDPSTPWTRFCDSGRAVLRLVKARDIKLLIPAASITIPVATVAVNLTLRYVPLRFGWTLTQTGMMLGVRTTLNILVLLVGLPALGSIVARQAGEGHDLVLARISTVLLFVGQAVFAVAPNMPVALVGLAVFTLGTGASSLCRAALIRLVGVDSVGRLFGVLAVCEVVGYVACGVGFGSLYQVGMKLSLGSDGASRPDRGDWWLALPFCVAAAFYFWAGGMLWVVDSKHSVEDQMDVEDPHRGIPGAGSRSAFEARVLADGRVTRKYPSLDNALVVM